MWNSKSSGGYRGERVIGARLMINELYGIVINLAFCIVLKELII